MDIEKLLGTAANALSGAVNRNDEPAPQPSSRSTAIPIYTHEQIEAIVSHMTDSAVVSSNSPTNFSALEPTRKQAGTVEAFVKAMNESPSRIGQQRGQDAEKALLRLGETEGFLGMTPKNTPYFNLKEGRYIYTKKGGWIDMVHFLFYAGRAYKYKQEGEKNPIGEAVQDGYLQERFDPAHSSYSYEDLPSDKFGADFAINYFNANSNLTLGEQVERYLKEKLEATDPKDAPNYDSLPEDDSKNAPSRTNRTTKPVYTQENPQ